MIIVDQIGNSLSLDQSPNRIISLVPSQTELLVDLGLYDSIVGVTKFCVHPENLRKEKVMVGGTKQVNYQKIEALQPDIILCSKEENTREIVEALEKIAPVHVSDIKTVEESSELIVQYGAIFKKEVEAAGIVTAIESQRSRFRESKKKTFSSKRVGYFIWKEPLMVAGSNTFINHLLTEIGFENAFVAYDGRYPEVQTDDLQHLDFIFLSSEPFPFKKEHLAFFQEKSNVQAILVDGEYFSWYGSRLIKAYPYFKDLIESLEL